MKRKTVTDPALPCCDKCKFFQQHYVQLGPEKYQRCAWGHCLLHHYRQALRTYWEPCEEFQPSSPPKRFHVKRNPS